jgi:hypothetical protein
MNYDALQRRNTRSEMQTKTAPDSHIKKTRKNRLYVTRYFLEVNFCQDIEKMLPLTVIKNDYFITLTVHAKVFSK